jgi:hypothetical protein
MKELLDKLRRDIRRLRDVGPYCNDDGINMLMDIHDELLRTLRKIEAAARTETENGAAKGVDDRVKRSSGASSAP